MCQRCIDDNRRIEHIAEEIYEKANKNLDNALYDLHFLGDYGGQKEMYLLQKYAPERYERKQKEIFDSFIKNIGKKSITIT